MFDLFVQPRFVCRQRRVYLLTLRVMSGRRLLIGQLTVVGCGFT
jgi:hypothetical protein